jgi:hypothetical protein
MFTNNEKYIKRIRGSQNINDYVEAVSSLFMEQEIIKGLVCLNDPNKK